MEKAKQKEIEGTDDTQQYDDRVPSRPSEPSPENLTPRTSKKEFEEHRKTTRRGG